MEYIIKTEHLTKHFGGIHAVEDISINVRKGEIYGFLGLNGAGKTTTIRMLLGMIRPTFGNASLFGEKVAAPRIDLWAKVGYLVETPSIYPELTVWENLEIVRKLRCIDDNNAVGVVIDKLGLRPYSKRKAGKLSLGNIQRLGLAKAFIHNPDILILDEPANGLDPAGIVEIREFLRDLSNNHNVTIFISSHILGEISKLATRIGIIHDGKLVQEINSENLEQLMKKRLLLDSKDKKSVKIELKKSGYLPRTTKDGLIELTDKKAIDAPDKIATLLVEAGLPPTLLKVDEEDLETYFLRTIGVEKE